jgi:hypothetical protein
MHKTTPKLISKKRDVTESQGDTSLFSTMDRVSFFLSSKHRVSFP